MTALIALIRKDLILYFSNRRALLITVAAPIAIAAFFGSLFGGSVDRTPAKIAIALVDLDGSATSQRIVAAIAADDAIEVRPLDAKAASDAVRRGKLRAVVTLPRGFGPALPRALFSRRDTPVVDLEFDPSQALAMQVVQGLLARHVMEAAMTGVFASGDATNGLTANARRDVLGSTTIDEGRRRDLLALFDSFDRVRASTAPSGEGTAPAGATAGDRAAQADGPRPNRQAAGGTTAPSTFRLPYTVRATEAHAAGEARYDGYSHSFAGMGVQFVLLMGVDLGTRLLITRRTGLWQRLRAAPLSRGFLLGSQLASGALIATMLFALIFAAGIAAFGVRVHGSLVGFAGLIVAFALMTAAFGLFIAALGRTPEATRGLAVFTTLVMVMLGGAWIPAFIFPRWLQTASFAVPTRWAVDGLDAMTWRGLGFEAAWLPIVVLLGFAVVFAGIAAWRFDWDEN